MLMEVVALSLTVFFSFQTISHTSSILQANISPPVESPIPAEERLGKNPKIEISSHIIPTQIPTVTPTIIPSPTVTPTSISSSTPTHTPTPTTIPAIITTDLEILFNTYSDMYHVDKELLKRIAQCESGYNTEATNNDYIGMFQFSLQSWTVTRTAMGINTDSELRKNADEAIKTAAYMIANGQKNAWLNCSN